MPIGVRGWKAWAGGILAVAAVAVVAVAWRMNRETPVPEIPRPDLQQLGEREVMMDLDMGARQVAMAPRKADAWGGYAIVLRAYQQHPEADRCFQVAADLDPANGQWPYLLGTHLADTDPVAAIPWLERAARGSVPALAREAVVSRLAEVLLAAGRPADALAALDADPTTSPPRVRLAAARAAAANGDDRTAAEFLGDLAYHPAAARQALLLRSEMCRRQGRTAYADHLARVVGETPEVPWPDPLADPIRSRDHSRGGRMEEAARLLRAGRPAEAELLLRAFTAGPRATDARAFVGMAEAREALGDRSGAVEALAQAVKLDPKNLAANYQLGLAFFSAGERLWAAERKDEARGEFQTAVAWLDKALAVNPDFGKAMLLRGTALHRFLGKKEEGLAQLKRFVQLRPEVGEGHLLLGQALADGGQRDEAEKALRRAAELAQPGDRRAADALAKLAPAGRP